MRSRLALVLSLFAFLLLSGTVGCPPPPPIEVISPPVGGTVSTPSFTIELKIDTPALEPGTLAATLNGAPLVLTGGPLLYTVAMSPGAPLLDSNLLHVEALARNGVAASVDSRFAYAPPKAHARRIADVGDLMTGPIAHGRLADFVIFNDVARFIVQDGQQRDLHSIGEFGGNLIDAELVGHPGKENFFEVQPSINVETVINAQTVEVLNDGQNGLPAEIRSCGPDDTMDYVNASGVAAQVGATFPPIADDVDYPVEGCTVFTLEPGKPFVKLDTTLFNMDTVTRGFYVGDYINGMGELEQWTNPLGVGEVATAQLDGGLAYIGFGEAQGVDYGFTGLPFSGSFFPNYTYFTTSGVSFVMASHSIPLVLFFGTAPTFEVAAGGSKTFTRYFSVGDGSGGNMVDMVNEVRTVAHGSISGCVTAGGAPAAGARVSIGTKNAAGTALIGVSSIWVTDVNGCYAGTVPTGSYGVVAAKEGFPFEGGGALPAVHSVTITNGGSATQNIALPATGTLHVSVIDEAGQPVPARVSIVGFDPSPEPTIVIPGGFGLPSAMNGTFNDVAKDGLSFGLARVAYTAANGVVDLDLEPGSYQVFVSRGTEYSAYDAPISVTSGTATTVAAQIARVIDTSGFVSSDYHVHAINSPDSRVNYGRRIQSFGGEGIENLILTEHDAHADLTGQIAASGFTPFLHFTGGEEITTFDYGHFNAYPLTVDPLRPSGGSTDHGGAAPAGQDFVQYGNYSLSPAQVYAAATGGSTSTPDTVVQINHIDSHFSPLRIDTSLVPPQAVLTNTQKVALRQNPSIANLFFHFPALELWNGSNRGDQTQFLNQRIGIWFNLLNQGLPTTMIGDTDTHTLFDVNGGGARTWTPSTSDAPAAISDAEIGEAVRSGRAVAGQGIYVQARLRAADGSGDVADFTGAGSTLVSSSNGAVDLEIDVQAPTWAEYDRIEIYANAATTATGSNGGVPVLFSATPTLVLDEGIDFTTSIVAPRASVPTAQRQQTTRVVSFTGLAQDTWFVVVVKGRDGVSKPMFPIFPQSLSATGNGTLASLLDGNLGQNGTMALGNTNALYADVNGVAGFQAPLAPLAP